MSFVLVSHASQDKKAIRHIVDALIADGHKIWLDTPADMDYGPEEVEAHFHRIHAGEPYRNEIDEALREAGAVLVCWSKQAKEDRTVWLAEATVARTLRKLIACRIDDVDRTLLPDNHGAEEIPDLRREREPRELRTALALIVADIRRKLATTRATRLVAAIDRPRDAFAPYLVDRTDQEDAIGAALESVATSGGVKAFCLAGPENECLEEFLERLQRYSCATRLGQGRSWHRAIVEWPGGETSGSFAAVYQRRLAVELSIPAASGPAEIAGALGRKGRPVAVLSLLSAREWKSDENRRVAAWLEMWHRMSEQPQRFAALPILCMQMPAAKPGWRRVPGGRAPGAAMSNSAIWRAVTRTKGGPGLLARLFGATPKRVPLEAPPILHPISRSHVDMWLWKADIAEQLASDKDKAVARIAELFSLKGADRHGHALKDFATGMSPIFRTGT